MYKRQVHHQADDLPRGVMLPGVLVVRLGEAADDLLENIAHFQVGDHVRVQVGLCLLYTSGLIRQK